MNSKTKNKIKLLRNSKILLLIFSLFISFVNEKYLRMFAQYYIDNYYQSSVPSLMYHRPQFIEEYIALGKVPFLSFIFIQMAFFIFVCIVLKYFYKLQSNTLQILSFSFFASLISYITVTPFHLLDFVNYFVEYFIDVNHPILLIGVVHLLLVSSFFYYFVNRNK